MKTIRVRGTTEAIPVGKILCLGRNYAEHVREMQAEVPEHPVVFIKPSTAIILDGENIIIPKLSREVHHEVELVLAIAKTGKHIQKQHASEYILGYAVGLDMTLRDVQSEAQRVAVERGERIRYIGATFGSYSRVDDTQSGGPGNSVQG